MNPYNLETSDSGSALLATEGNTDTNISSLEAFVPECGSSCADTNFRFAACHEFVRSVEWRSWFAGVEFIAVNMLGWDFGATNGRDIEEVDSTIDVLDVEKRDPKVCLR